MDLSDRSTAQANLLDHLPQSGHEWTQSLLMSPGKAAVGDGRRGLLTLFFTIPLKPTLLPAKYNPAVYCNTLQPPADCSRQQRVRSASLLHQNSRDLESSKENFLAKSYYVHPNNFLHLCLER